MKKLTWVCSALIAMLISCKKEDTTTIVITPPPTPVLDVAAIGTWRKLSDFTGEKRSNALSFVINGKGYILGGNNGKTWLADLYEYDPAMDKWTKKADFPIADKNKSVVMVINNKAYTGLGLNKDDKLAQEDWYEYDPATDKWTKKQKTTLFFGRVGGFAFSSNGKGYFGGGYANGLGGDLRPAYLRNFYEYDASTDSWKEKAPLPEEEGNITTEPSVNLNGNGCLVGKSGTWVYDTQKNEWSKLAMGASSIENCFTIGKFLYYGLNGNSNLATIDTELKIRGDNTKLMSSAPIRKEAIVFVIGKKAYFGTGKNIEIGQLFSDLYEFSIP